MATLAVGLVLVIAASILSFSVAKSGIMEQKISANERRAREAAYAAEAALDYGVAWASRNRLPVGGWTAEPSPSSFEYFDFAGTTPSVSTDPDPGDGVAEGDLFSTNLRFRRDTGNPEFVQVIATAVSADGVSARMSQYVRPQYLVETHHPPLVVDGCIYNFGRGPHLWPAATGATSLASTHNPINDVFCLSVPASELELHDGILTTGYLTAGALWETAFNLPKEAVQALSAAEAYATTHDSDSDGNPDMNPADRTFYWVDSVADGTWSDSLGSATHPVVLVFAEAAGCPSLASGVVIYGVVYFEVPAPECDLSGWGGGIEIYGSLFFEGHASGLASAVTLADFSTLGGGSLHGLLPPLRAPQIVGSWKDF
jgi:hypothetical protein